MITARGHHRRRHQHNPILTLLITVTLTVLPGCQERTTGPVAGIDIESFRAMARASGCAEQRNRLYLIDRTLVFWERSGACPDAAYCRVLFKGTVENVMCREADSIAGPVKGCPNPSYSPMFDTIVANLDRPNLGLGPAHTVQRIPF